MEYYYKQPKYYSSFHCIGGECPVSCCDGWNVDWYDAEIEKLKNAEKSDELGRKVNDCFEFKEIRKRWLIKMCEDKRCPFHNRETGLCDIQSELGDNYLGDTCTNYPRVYYLCSNIVLRSISSSCPALLDIIFNNENAVKMDIVLGRKVKEKYENTLMKYDNKNNKERYPYLKARLQITDFMLELLHGNRSLESSMILAALAAKKISDAGEKDDITKIERVIQTLREQTAQASAAQAADDIEPNYKLKFVIVNNLIVKYFGDEESGVNISVLHDGERVILANYERGKEEFYNAFAGREYVIRNIAENMFLDVFYHLNIVQDTFFDIFAYFTACVATVQVFAQAIGFASKDIERDFIKAVAHLSRGMSHNKTVASKVVEEMKSLGLTTPAHLAIIIK